MGQKEEEKSSIKEVLLSGFTMREVSLPISAGSVLSVTSWDVQEARWIRIYDYVDRCTPQPSMSF